MSWSDWIWRLLNDRLYDVAFVALGAVITIVRASGITINDGQTGLKFSFGRATRVLSPGFHPLFPFLQTARVVYSRSRTLDLPAQRVETRERLVVFADANLVYKIVDVRKAVIEIDELEKGMLQMIGIGVQEVMRVAKRAELARTAGLDHALTETLSARLEQWGVVVERAGFKSITPNRQTLRITQLDGILRERRNAVQQLSAAGHGHNRALALAGTRTHYQRRAVALRRVAQAARRDRQLRAGLIRKGWNNVQIKQAGLRLRSRLTTGGVLARSGAAPAKSGAKKPAESKPAQAKKARGK